ncbi:hypothetical protein CRE_18988 [Caenorhabditis remanei]|uniref:Uncharacterized protein n=1 Tax=Caenorhabditis remanei TaxID=31234 RepID=E3LKY3_CAERE|nr:hypothetical protein CRE_18988 [Caenorhabditis remanei]
MSQLCHEGLFHFLSSPDSLKSICHIITFIEIPFHFFGVYCIAAKTPRRMRNVKRSMLIMHFSIICLKLIMSCLLIPFMMVPALAGVPLGLLEDWDIPLSFQMYLAVTGPAVTGITIVAVFENRYFLVCNNFYWRKIRIPYILFNYLTAFLCFLYPILQVPDQKTLTTAIPMIFVIFLVFVQAIIVILLIYHFFYTERFKLSENTTQMQKKFMKALFGQFLLFVMILGVPVSVFTFSMFLDDYNQGLNNLCIIILSLNGLISTSAMILLHQPYREWILGIFM